MEHPSQNVRVSDKFRNRLYRELYKHVGKQNKIGMAELYSRVYRQPWANRINDTRALRYLITELRNDGVPICSDRHGYWLASAGSELDDYCRRVRTQALKKLRQEARLRKMTLPQLVGQLSLDLVENTEEE